MTDPRPTNSIPFGRNAVTQAATDLLLIPIIQTHTLPHWITLFYLYLWDSGQVPALALVVPCLPTPQRRACHSGMTSRFLLLTTNDIHSLILWEMKKAVYSMKEKEEKGRGGSLVYTKQFYVTNCC